MAQNQAKYNHLKKHGGTKPPPTLLAFTLSQPNLAWKYETSGQSKLVIGWHQISNHDVIFADVIHT